MWKAELHIDKLYRASSSKAQWTQSTAQALLELLNQTPSPKATIRKIVGGEWDLLDSLPDDERQNALEVLQQYKDKRSSDYAKNIWRSVCVCANPKTGPRIQSPPWTQSAAAEMVSALEEIDPIRLNAIGTIIKDEDHTLLTARISNAENLALAKSIVEVHRTRWKDGLDIEIVSQDMSQALKRFINNQGDSKLAEGVRSLKEEQLADMLCDDKEYAEPYSFVVRDALCTLDPSEDEEDLTEASEADKAMEDVADALDDFLNTDR